MINYPINGLEMGPKTEKDWINGGSKLNQTAKAGHYLDGDEYLVDLAIQDALWLTWGAIRSWNIN